MLRSLFSWVCIFTILILPSVSSADLLLCVGDDGHVAIEKNYQGSCEKQDVHHDEHDGITESHCGSCVDMPLLQNAFRGASIENRSAGTYIECKHPPIFVKILPTLTTPTQIVKNKRLNFSLALDSAILKTIVLLL
jgi:hypothetical protein